MIQLVKCALIGTPTLLLGRALYESLDIIPVVSSIEEIINILASAKELPKPNRNRALEYFYFIMTRGQDFYFSNPIHWFKVEANNRINEIVEQLEAKTGIALFGVNDISKKLFYTLGIGKVFCFIDNSTIIDSFCDTPVFTITDLLSDNIHIDTVVLATERHTESMIEDLSKANLLGGLDIIPFDPECTQTYFK